MISYDNFKDLCANRRSIRYFDNRPLEKHSIQMLLDVAILAPSVQNTQPWRFHVVTNQELKDKIMQSSCYGNFISGAGTFILVTADMEARKDSPEVLWNPRELEYSCVSAMNQMILAATAMGIGSCWVSLHHGAAAEILKLPKHQLIVGGIMVGNLKRGEEEASGTHARKDLSDCVQWHE